jgi:SagB-type dehydrogenase family enzyme
MIFSARTQPFSAESPMDPRSELFFSCTELDPTTWPDFRDRIATFDQSGALAEPRSYPGYPRWQLPKVRTRWWPPLDRALSRRRSRSQLGQEPPSSRVLSRLLWLSHGSHAEHHRGPTPSAGGLQALELYLAWFGETWLPRGVYHYDRAAHALAQLAAAGNRETWGQVVPSLATVAGGSLLWLVVGDAARVHDKYGPRGLRFLLLEAGHLMQNLCMVSASLRQATVPLGAFYESAIARLLRLPATDVVLYAGLLGGV